MNVACYARQNDNFEVPNLFSFERNTTLPYNHSLATSVGVFPSQLPLFYGSGGQMIGSITVGLRSIVHLKLKRHKEVWLIKGLPPANIFQSAPRFAKKGNGYSGLPTSSTSSVQSAAIMLNGKIVQFNACQNLFMTTLSSAIPVSKLLLLSSHHWKFMAVNPDGYQHCAIPFHEFGREKREIFMNRLEC